MMRLGLLVLGLLSVIPLSAVWARERPPVEAFASLPAISKVAISADGSKIVFGASTPSGASEVRLYDLTTKSIKTVSMGENKLRSVSFEDGGNVLLTASGTTELGRSKYEFYRTFAIDFETGTQRMLLARGGEARVFNTGTALICMLPDEPNVVLMSAFDYLGAINRFSNLKNPFVSGLYRVKMDSNSVERIEVGTEFTYDWLCDGAGKPVARVDHDPDRGITTLYISAGPGDWQKVLEHTDRSTRALSLQGISKDGLIVFAEAEATEFGKLKSIHPATRTIQDFVRAEGVELESAKINPWTNAIFGVETGGLQPVTQLLDAQLSASLAALEAIFPGKRVDIVSFSRDKTKVVALVQTSSEPGRYYLFDATARTILQLGNSMPALKNVELATVKATTFKSRDGVDIPVYVTSPPANAAIRNAPTIIFPHGGPESRDFPEFDWWAQFMATRGYVVIQPQFRGSTGFGSSHSTAGRRQWGKRMQDDLSDSVAWAIKEGMTDPSRVCIVGASYGGYAALVGATLTPDLYKCVVSVNGVSDLPIMLGQEFKESGYQLSDSINYWRMHIGADDVPAMIAASPRRHAGHVRAPILLIHGKDDTVVAYEQSNSMARALRAASKPFKLVTLKDEDHWLSRPTTRLQMLTEIEVFLREHLGPGVE